MHNPQNSYHMCYLPCACGLCIWGHLSEVYISQYYELHRRNLIDSYLGHDSEGKRKYAGSACSSSVMIFPCQPRINLRIQKNKTRSGLFSFFLCTIKSVLLIVYGHHSSVEVYKYKGKCNFN